MPHLARGAVARWDEVTPEFLRILEESADRAAQLAAKGDYMAHLYAMFLLPQFREIRAYPLEMYVLVPPHRDEHPVRVVDIFNCGSKRISVYAPRRITRAFIVAKNTEREKNSGTGPG